jgi:sugar phosphate permease
MALVGFCLFGPDTLISGAAAQDIGGKHDVAKAAGFINGFGSTGAVFQGLVTSGMSTSRFGGTACSICSSRFRWYHRSRC